MNVLVVGIDGKMSSRIVSYIKKNYDFINILGFDKMDCLYDIDFLNLSLIIDFSKKSIASTIIYNAICNNVDIISGTTGFSKKEIIKFKRLAKKNKTKFIWSPNFSKGYSLLKDFCIKNKTKFDTIELIEQHNINKLDKPSGTAKMLASYLAMDESNIVSIREKDFVATHRLVFKDEFESITITHTINDRLPLLDGFICVFNKYLEDNG